MKGSKRYETTVLIGKTSYRHVASTLTEAKSAEVVLVGLRRSIIDYTKRVIGVKENPLHTINGTKATVFIEPGVKVIIDLSKEEQIENYISNCLKGVDEVNTLLSGVFRKVVHNKVFFLLSTIFSFEKALASKYAEPTGIRRDSVNFNKSNLKEVAVFNKKYQSLFKQD